MCIYKKKTDVNNIHILEAACVVHVRFNEPFTEWILKRTRYIKTTKILPVSDGLPTALMTICSFYYLFFFRRTGYKKNSSLNVVRVSTIILDATFGKTIQFNRISDVPNNARGSVKHENSYIRLIKRS